MQKLKRAYPELQSDAKNNFDKVTIERARMLYAYANKQYESQVAQGQYGNLDQLDFYREKFHLLVDLFNNAIANKTKKSKLQTEVNSLLADSYGQSGITPQGPQYIRQETRQLRNEKQSPHLQNEAIIREEKLSSPKKIDPKEVLHSFFDNRVNDIQKNKVGFKSVLDTMPKVGQRRNVKASNIQGSKVGNNDKQIQSMSSEIKSLSKKLEDEKEAGNFNQGLYQAQKQDYETRIRDLIQQIENLNRQNEGMKNQQGRISHISRPRQSPPEFPRESPLVQNTKIIHQYRHFGPEDSPHTIKYRENDLFKIKQKNHFQDDSFRKSGHNEPPLMQNQRETKLEELVRKRSDEEIYIPQQPIERIELHLEKNDEFQKSNLRFARSEADNEDKNISVRSKLSFFKPEIVLYRGELFQLALKSYDLIELQSRRIVIFINNKDKFDHTATISYVYDPQYYDLNVVRKVRELRSCKQNKEEVQIRWKDKMDFDSMIEVKLCVQTSVLNSKEIKFLLPTMFIEFTNRKPEFYYRELYEKTTITPIYQFSSIYLAQDIIPFQKNYEDKVEVATIFARSKQHEGYITLRWKVRGEVEVETIRPWKLFFSYLFSKDY